uniref:MADF domain-containing protein n=1 Tax=Sipha flava TaxID=143950 RepID=A0A2S2QF04_9HEMI
MNDDKLITLVREYPVLYDSSHEKYNDRNYKSTIWSKIAEEMETTGPSAKTRWASIKDSYRRYVKKNQTVSDKKAKILKKYKQLSFITKFFDKRGTMSSIDDKVTNEEYSRNCEPQHPVDAFLSSIAPVLKKLTPCYWHYAKSEIFASVQNYELKVIMDQEQFVEQLPISTYYTQLCSEQSSSAALSSSNDPSTPETSPFIDL